MNEVKGQPGIVFLVHILTAHRNHCGKSIVQSVNTVRDLMEFRMRTIQQSTYTGKLVTVILSPSLSLSPLHIK